MYTAGSCATGLGAFYPGSRLLYVLDLGEATPLGGTLTLTTCGHSTNNTVLYVGTGCPTWALPFACRSGNDNAAGPACGSNPLASTVAITAAQVTYYVQVGGWWGGARAKARTCSARVCARSVSHESALMLLRAARAAGALEFARLRRRIIMVTFRSHSHARPCLPPATVKLGGFNGAPVVSGLGWAYTPPVSATGTGPRSGTGTGTRTRSRTRSGTRSRTRSGTRSRTWSGSRTRSRKAK